MAGCLVPERFAFFPEGFPRGIMDPFEATVGLPALGNKPASGTVITSVATSTPDTTNPTAEAAKRKSRLQSG